VLVHAGAHGGADERALRVADDRAHGRSVAVSNAVAVAAADGSTDIGAVDEPHAGADDVADAEADHRSAVFFSVGVTERGAFAWPDGKPDDVGTDGGAYYFTVERSYRITIADPNKKSDRGIVY
jgi:hypothetical protein